MRRFIRHRWFLIVLAALLGIGFTWGPALVGPAHAMPRGMIVASVLFLVALPMDARAMWRALSRPKATLLAIAINLGIVPPLAWLARPLLPPELGTGLIIIAAIPCTLASAAVWTRRAGGNDAVAIMVTMITNLGCFLVTPAWLRVLTRTDVPLDVGSLVARLALLVFLPIVAAQTLRAFKPVAVWAGAQKTLLGVLAQWGVLTVVLLGSIDAGMRVREQDSSQLHQPLFWVKMVAVVVGVHLVALVLGHVVSAMLKIDRRDRIAVGFAGSQKTLVVGLDVGMQYFGGLTILPMVTYHVGQLLVDTLIADKLAAAKPELPDDTPGTE